MRPSQSPHAAAVHRGVVLLQRLKVREQPRPGRHDLDSSQGGASETPPAGFPKGNAHRFAVSSVPKCGLAKERLTVVIRRPEGLVGNPPSRREDDEVRDGHAGPERLGGQHCENGWVLRRHEERLSTRGKRGDWTVTRTSPTHEGVFEGHSHF